MGDGLTDARVHRDNPTIGLTFKEQTGCGSSFFSIKFNWHDKVKLVEVFCGSSSKGGCSSNTKMTGRLVSLALQNNVPIEEILDQLESEICPTARYRAGRDEGFKKTGNSSCSKALASAIRKTLQAQKFFEDHQDELRAIFSSVDDLRGKTVELAKDRIEKSRLSEIFEKSEPFDVLPEDLLVDLPADMSVVKDNVAGVKSFEISDISVGSPLLEPIRLSQAKERAKFFTAGVPYVGDEGKGEDYWIQRGLCPECRAALGHEEGCVICRRCSFSKC